MKTLTYAMQTTALVAGLSVLATAACAEGDLFIYTWGEYTPPDLVAKFEAEFSVKVHIDT